MSASSNHENTFEAGDAWVQRALARWPGIPACHGWLALDGRGRWLLDGKPVTHGGLRTFLARHYHRDEDGAWYVQNGPQQVFVDLELAPWVASLDGTGALVAHTGEAIGLPEALLIDEAHRLYLVAEDRLAALCDRDYDTFCAGLSLADSAGEDPEAALAALLLLDQTAPSLALRWQDHPLPARFETAAALESLFDFRRSPRA